MFAVRKLTKPFSVIKFRVCSNDVFIEIKLKDCLFAL